MDWLTPCLIGMNLVKYELLDMRVTKARVRKTGPTRTGSISSVLMGMGLMMQAQAETSLTADEQQLVELYRQMNVAMVAQDVGTLDRMLAPDYSLTHMTGYRQSRAEWLSDVKTERIRYFETREVSVKPSIQGERGTLTGRAHTKANVWGLQGTWGLQLEISFSRKNGKWLMTEAVASSF